MPDEMTPAGRAGFARARLLARLAAAIELTRAYDSAVQYYRYVGALTSQHRDRINQAEARYDRERGAA